MKRFFLGMLVGLVLVSTLWSRSRAYQGPPPPPVVVHLAQYTPPPPGDGFPPPPDGRTTTYGDIPVPVVPGSRVTEAQSTAPTRKPERPAPPRRPHPGTRPSHPVPPPATKVDNIQVVKGQLSASEDRAKEDVEKKVNQCIITWLAPDVASSWDVPERLRRALVLKTEVKGVEKTLDGERVTLYEASQTLDLSSARRTEIVEVYHRELVMRRLMLLAGVIAFILACLAALAGYIRTDEATKGYYTNRLRLVAAAGVGAAGVVLYRLLV